MKLLDNSFLFFCITNIMFIMLNFYSANALQQNNNDSLIYYQRLVDHPLKSSDLSKSYQFFLNHKKNAVNKNETISVIYDLIQMAKIEYKGGSYTESKELAVNALTRIEKLKETPYNKLLKRTLYTHLGIIYREQNNSKKALNLYNKTLKIAKTVDDSIIVFNNISNIYKDKKAYNETKKELLKAYNLISKTTDSLNIALIIDNLGFVKSKLNEEDALTYLNKALELRKKIRANDKTYISYRHLSEYYSDRNDTDKAKEYALTAYDLAKQINSASYKEDALSSIVELGNDKYAKAYKTISDSIKTVKQTQENKFALMKYDVSKKQKELETSERKRERTILALLFILSLFILIYLNQKNKHKKDKIQQVYNIETRISKKVHDEVSNDIYHLLTKLQSNSNVKEDVLDDLGDIYIRTRDISKENSVIEVKEDYDVLLKDLLISFKNDDVNILTKNISKINWETIDEVKKTTLYRVLQELMINMKKHSKASLAVLNFNQVRNKITITYNDNGIGANIKKGSGIRNVENRMKSINGTIIFESEINKGFKATITV